MRKALLTTMSADDLWQLREKLGGVLSAKLDAEIREIQRRLARLQGRIVYSAKEHRRYPKVRPKFVNPRSGEIKVDDLLIGN